MMSLVGFMEQIAVSAILHSPPISFFLQIKNCGHSDVGYSNQNLNAPNGVTVLFFNTVAYEANGIILLHHDNFY